MDRNYYSDFQYVGSRVVSLKIRNDFVSLNNDGVKKTLDISHEIKEIGFNEENQSYSGILHLRIRTSVAIQKQKYIVDITLEGCFEDTSSEMSEEDFGEMLGINGLTSLYSIARGIVQSVSSQTLMNGSILLPMINVIEYSQDVTSYDTDND